ncbi:histidine kinase N-terminal 7TM domain-containing protein [Natronomonas sp.]|uniref:sensor histidine kinase n=1 Tax=Natronomonas sp. TaxID=2184060 RepID=UPI002618005E|nr:histidine kinase N-terminal 7TM domain-containing protein [Natronomonas sp.]
MSTAYGTAIVVGTLAAGVGSVALLRYLLRYVGRAGAAWFVVTIAAQALSAFAYGVGLLVFDPAARAFAEAFLWIGIACLGPTFLGFVLTYTGRSGLTRSLPFRSLFVVPLGTTALALTHPFHGLLWREFRIAPVFELSTVLYEIQPWAFLSIAVSLGTAAIGVLLLLETILSYGPLYRREAIAVALSTLPPAAGAIVWLAGVGPWPELNLAPLLLLPHVLFDAYAFVGTHMFETNPTTQRAAEHNGFNGLRDPILTVDADARVVNANREAAELFGIDDASFPLPIAELTGVGLGKMRSAGEMDIPGIAGGVFAVSYTSLSDPSGEAVGGMVVLYDVTEQRRREQQLAVFNRVLRHNLRNEMTVIRGHANSLEADLSDPGLSAQAGAIADAGDRLLSIGDKAQRFDRVQEREVRPTEIDLRGLLGSIEAELRERHDETGFTLDAETEAGAECVRSDAEMLSLILSNLIENAILHAEGDPTVAVRAYRPEADPDAVAFEVRDDNAAISDLEIASIRAGDETPLQHGTGIGLWIVTWCLTALNGDLEFGYDEGNVVTVSLPTAGDA